LMRQTIHLELIVHKRKPFTQAKLAIQAVSSNYTN